MSIYIIDSLESMWTSSANDYSIFDCLIGKYGVYIFRNPFDGSILYIGEARTQDLRTRIKQNFTIGDTGGTFRDNYKNFEKAGFEGFRDYIRNKQIIIITSEKNMLIRALESIMISILKPKYNKDT